MPVPQPMVRIVREPLDREEIARSVEHPSCGAVSVFAGVVRDHSEGKAVASVRYEAYEPMALRKLEEIAGTLRERYGLGKAAIRHRLGDLAVGETSVVMAVSSAHRKEAFEAIREGMEILKETVPIFKEEVYADGTTSWAGC